MQHLQIETDCDILKHEEEEWHREEEERRRGHTTLAGEVSGQRDWQGHTVGSFKFRTTGPKCGRGLSGGLVQVEFENHACMSMEVTVDGGKPHHADSIVLTFYGADEVVQFIENIKFLAEQLELVQRLATQKGVDRK